MTNIFYSRCNNSNIKPREVSFLTTKGVMKTNTSAGASSSNVDEIGKVYYKINKQMLWNLFYG